ncbi:MAG: AAA family ATPase [Polyangiaceae bacterium]
MTDLDDLFGLPSPPSYHVDWQGLHERFDWIRAMQGVPQDPIWHAEGDVWIHSRMVCEALAADPEWRALDLDAKRITWLAALLHDVAKPYSTQIEGPLEGGRIRSRHHSPRGAIHARRLLWRAGLAHPAREQVAGIVRHHQLPIYALEGDQGERRTSAASLRCRLDLLAIVAAADIRGRHCDDQAGKLESIDLFRDYARELDCFATPRRFPSDHTRVMYFRRGRPAMVEAYDDTRSEVTVMTGLPASGKTYWRKQQPLPVVSLDELRQRLGVDPAGDQSRVRAAAREEAQGHLRAGRDFIWDATNLEAQRRGRIIDMALDYHARVRIIAVEASAEDVERDNASRPRPVPRDVVDAMLRRWEAPDLTEAHQLEWVGRTHSAE